jgi:hypothetical protein
VRLETDADGEVTAERSYDAFGNELGSPTMSGNRLRYTGRWSDGCIRAWSDRALPASND